MSADEKNMELMKTLDDAWNSQDWIEIPSKNVMQNDVAIFWPGQPDLTRAVHNHRKESVEFFKTFPDNHLVNNPYKILFSKDDYTCSVADFSDTFKGPVKGLDGKIIRPTKEKFHIEFCTIAHWKDEKILEERLFYDVVGMLAQIGVMPSST